MARFFRAVMNDKLLLLEDYLWFTKLMPYYGERTQIRASATGNRSLCALQRVQDRHPASFLLANGLINSYHHLIHHAGTGSRILCPRQLQHHGAHENIVG